MGTTDRVVRFLLAIGIVALYFSGSITGVAAILLGAVAIVLLVTSVVAFCPGYVPFGITTHAESSKSVHAAGRM